MTEPLHYTLTVNSPWAFFGSSRFAAIAQKAGREVVVHTADFGKVFSVSGGLPLPQRAEQRKAYRMVELKRWSAELGIPLVLQPSNASSPQLGNLAVLAVRESGGDALAAAHAIGEAFWVEDKDIADEAVLSDALDKAGLAGSSVVAKAKSDTAIAEAFEADTQRAIDTGIFGAPWYEVDGEPFWGQDRVDLIAKKLGVLI